MLGSIPHQKFCFYHLPTRGRAGIKLGDAWYVSNVSITFDCSMLLYYLFWMFNGLYYILYIIFGTIILTGGPAQSAVFLPISVFRRKGISNGVQTEWNFGGVIFGTNVIQRTWSGHQEIIEEATRQGGAPKGVGAPPPSWAPRSSIDVLLSPIYTLIPQKHPGEPRNHFSTAATICIREIPSWGLFQHPAGGGFDHGGLLHQHHCLFDEAWVVYHRPTSP